jgi:S1-C subfamily serine protease
LLTSEKGSGACFYSPVTILDWGIVAFTAAVALWGFREGPVVGVLITGVALAFVWLLGVAALHGPVTTELRHDARQSLILSSLDDVLPPSDSVVRALRRIDPAPSIPGRVTPVAPPDAAIATDPDVLAAGRSVVRVLGTACGLGFEGSGWVAAPGLVITNAHVIAGEDDTSVNTQDGASLAATPVRYDTRNDLAVLRIGADIPALRLASETRRGETGAVLGYPQNGPYAVIPARASDTREVISEDSYGRGPVRRTIVSLRGTVRSGNSGGPLVDSRGRVLATVFAATTSGPPGGFAIPNGVVRNALRETTTSVDTGACVR